MVERMEVARQWEGVGSWELGGESDGRDKDKQSQRDHVGVDHNNDATTCEKLRRSVLKVWQLSERALRLRQRTKK